MDFGSWLDSLVPANQWVLAVAYLFGVLAAHFLIAPTLSIMWKLLKLEAKIRNMQLAATKDEQEDAFIRYTWQTASVGFVERAMYIVSLQMQRPEFIAVWLTLKTVAQSKRWTQEDIFPGRAVYNNFLVGNGLSILYALAAAGVIQWATGPSGFRNYMLAVSVPLALILANAGFILWLKWHRAQLQVKIEAIDQSTPGAAIT